MRIATNLWHKLRHLVQQKKKDISNPYEDPITGTMTFARFKDEVKRLFHLYPKDNFAISYLDIKNFKYINDVYGFEIGDSVLRYFSNILSENPVLMFCRINADNFVSLERYNNKSELQSRYMRRIEQASNIETIIPTMPHITVFTGIYCTDGNNEQLSIDAMIDRANIAKRQSRMDPHSTCTIYQEEFRFHMLEEQQMENQMEQALENGEFIVYLQPKFNIHTNRIAAAEALVRWNHPENGILSPNKFIPLFERNGFIQKLDTYMFKQVCILIRNWLDEGIHPVPISVNVSRVQLNNPSFPSSYISLKEKYRIPDKAVEIEFTESMMFDNSTKMMNILKVLKSCGFLSSIDDFGSGYSSLNLLKTLPTDILKLDKVFFDTNTHKNRDQVIIKNVISMAKELDMQTVAEGVEHWEQVDFLRNTECELVQGFVYDCPIPVEQFEKKYIGFMRK